MTTRVLHVSDLHTGTREDREVEQALAVLVERTGPELIIASGDLAHRGRREQLERATGFLRSFEIPVLAVPGNHDLPYVFPARFTTPWAEFERLWETTEPTYTTPALHVVGLCSARPYRHQSGGLKSRQLASADERLRAGPEGAYRIVVLHHHMVGSPWRAARKRPVARRNHVLRTLVEAGADLIVAGHIHQAAVSERHEFEVVSGDVHATIVSIAPGFGQPRPNRLGEARGLHVYDIGERSLTVNTHIWRDSDWGLTAQRTFPRGYGVLATSA